MSLFVQLIVTIGSELWCDGISWGMQHTVIICLQTRDGMNRHKYHEEYIGI